MTDNSYGKILNPQILDFNIGNRSELLDLDFMKGADFDIDWSAFSKDVLESPMVKNSKMNVTSVTYTVEISSTSVVASNKYEVTRVFTPTHVKAVPCNEYSVNYGIRPKFKWTIPQSADTFTAFSIQVKDAGKKVIWKSGFNKMPAPSPAGEYEWLAPLYVNDLASAGNVYQRKIVDGVL